MKKKTKKIVEHTPAKEIIQEGVSIDSTIESELSEKDTIKSTPKKQQFRRIEERSPKQVEKYIFDVLNDQCYQEQLIKTWDTPDGEASEDFGMYWISKESNLPITPVGMEHDLHYLVRCEIDDHLGHGLGFSTSNQKWYGWSHRAIYGFGIGSTCTIGDAHYKPSNKDEMVKSCSEFWGNNERDEEGGFNTRLIAVEANVPEPEQYCVYDIKEDKPKSLNDSYKELFEVQDTTDVSVQDKPVQGEIPERAPIDPNKLGVSIITRTEFFGPQEGRGGYTSTQWTPYPEVWGKGSWTATTLEEAKQMASDFSDGVS